MTDVCLHDQFIWYVIFVYLFLYYVPTVTAFLLMLYNLIPLNYIFLYRRYDLTRKMNPIIEDLLNLGCVSDEKENDVLNSLEDILSRLKG